MQTFTDAKGRLITLRRLTVMDQVKLLRAIGPAQSINQPYVEIVTMAASVAQVGDVPCPMPTNERQIDAAIERIGDEGFVALSVYMRREVEALQAAAETAVAYGEKPESPLAPSA
jgi:hypothetical protein